MYVIDFGHMAPRKKKMLIACGTHLCKKTDKSFWYQILDSWACVTLVITAGGRWRRQKRTELDTDKWYTAFSI